MADSQALSDAKVSIEHGFNTFYRFPFMLRFQIDVALLVAICGCCERNLAVPQPLTLNTNAHTYEYKPPGNMLLD